MTISAQYMPSKLNGTAPSSYEGDSGFDSWRGLCRYESMAKEEEDPNRPFSVARVAVWALGIIALACAIGLIMVPENSPKVARLTAIVQTSVGGLVAVAAAKVPGSK